MSSVSTPQDDSQIIEETDHHTAHDQSLLLDEESEDISAQIGRQATRQNIKVICRIRPTNEREIANDGFDILKHNDETIDVKSEDYDHHFNFDHVFGKNTSQVEMFEKCAKPLISDVFAGYNATIFAYGQTGTGKTYTMEGDIEDDAQKGIIPRSIEALFEFIATADDTIEFTIKVSYIEIYMERIRDLLDHTRTKINLTIREHKNTGVFIADVTEEYVTSVRGILRLMQIGAKNRSVAATGMNEGSSRSHSVFTVTVSQKNIHTGEVKTGKLVLVDLAGSEMVKKTNSSGQQLEEAKTINKSLSALGLVIYALTDEKATHIPYRDSKLTRLLQDSLGGNAKTVLIIAVSPSSYNGMETVSTLRFGTRAKSIENKVEVNRSRTVEMLEALLEKAELAIDRQTAVIAALRARIEVLSQAQQGVASSSSLTQSTLSENGSETATATSAQLKALEDMQEVLDRLNAELAEEREYSLRVYTKLEEVKAISDGRRALIEDATAMLEAIQRAKIALEEQLAALKTDKATLLAELQQAKASALEEASKMNFKLKERESHVEALKNEMQVLQEENNALKEKALATPRVRSLSALVSGVPSLTQTALSAAIAATRIDKEPAAQGEKEEESETTANGSKFSEEIMAEHGSVVDLLSTTLSAKIIEKVVGEELLGDGLNKLELLSAGEELEIAVREKLDELRSSVSEAQSKCDRLEIERQELQQKIEQRDERIEDLEKSNATLNSQLFEQTKAHSQEIEDLRTLVQTMRVEHEQEKEELKKAMKSATPIKPNEADLASPRTIRGGALSPVSLLNRSLASLGEDEREKALERKRSMDMLRQEIGADSPAFFPPTPQASASSGVRAPRERETETENVAIEDVMQPEVLLAASPVKKSVAAKAEASPRVEAVVVVEEPPVVVAAQAVEEATAVESPQSQSQSQRENINNKTSDGAVTPKAPAASAPSSTAPPAAPPAACCTVS